VWHQGLIYHLHELGCPSYLGNWLVSYLSNRYFSTRIGSSLSSNRSINAGVPQGSVLGPLLFIIFFNDIIKDISCAEVALYADDIAAWKSSPYFKIINNRLQEFLDKIGIWLSKWRVKLNASKTIYTVFTRTTKKLALSFSGSQIAYSNSPKFLGITLDPRLTFKHYVNDLKTRCTRRLNMMRSIKGRDWGLSEHLLTITYKSLIRSLIDYAPLIQLLLSAERKLIIARIQSRAARIITGISILEHTHKTDLNAAVNLESTEDRAMSLSTAYVKSAIKFNIVISNLIEQYNKNPEGFEGFLCKTTPRPSIL